MQSSHRGEMARSDNSGLRTVCAPSAKERRVGRSHGRGVPRPCTNAVGAGIDHRGRGTIFDRTTVPLRLGFLAMVLLAVDHGGTSAWALSRELGLRYATA